MAVLRTLIISHEQARLNASELCRSMPDGVVVQFKEPSRSLEQNAMLWVLLGKFSAQLQWPVNGRMTRLTPDEWKDILSAAYKRETQRVAAGIDGGMVMLGLRTSKLGKREFAEFIEFIQSVAAGRCVDLGD